MIAQHVEAVEARRLLAIMVTDTSLRIEGTAESDEVHVSLGNGQFTVNFNGDVQTFPVGTIIRVKMFGRAGDDRLELDPSVLVRARLGGDDGNDTLVGGNRRDTLDGDAGDNKLYGRGGPDTLYGDDGADLLNGGTGDDELWGQRGMDLLRGGDGNDYLDAGHDSDRLEGGAGNDTLRGNAEADVVLDEIYGGKGFDFCHSSDEGDVNEPFSSIEDFYTTAF